MVGVKSVDDSIFSSVGAFLYAWVGACKLRHHFDALAPFSSFAPYSILKYLQ